MAEHGGPQPFVIKASLHNESQEVLLAEGHAYLEHELTQVGLRQAALTSKASRCWPCCCLLWEFRWLPCYSSLQALVGWQW